jgi:hypothetical protein
MSTIDFGGHTNVGQRCKWALGLLVLGLFALQSTASHSQDAIGSATSVKPQAEANTRMLSGGSTVYSKELIHTGDAGVADLRFHDNTNLSVGPKSSVRLDRFVYDPNKFVVGNHGRKGGIVRRGREAPAGRLPS